MNFRFVFALFYIAITGLAVALSPAQQLLAAQTSSRFDVQNHHLVCALDEPILNIGSHPNKTLDGIFSSILTDASSETIESEVNKTVRQMNIAIPYYAFGKIISKSRK